ncbi:unnamed protein product [Brassica oleracea var. botrytis]|uniref:Jacalin-type lectin domain-containing protein n=2 Tax=Brassica oleracea TaxID=3712 RepID=A0A0D3C7X6_BRAOL|nr:unnamed protein product [Brassica oleracea]
MHEYITGISGEYYKYKASNSHIRSLKFTTNTSEYGPFVSMGLMMMHPDYTTSVFTSDQRQSNPKTIKTMEKEWSQRVSWASSAVPNFSEA